MKALGTGWGRGVGWKDVEILSEGNGRPSVVLSGAVRRLAGNGRILLSITHGRDAAAAVAVFENEEGSDS